MAWLHFQYYPPDRSNEILSQILWLNSNILIKGKPFIWWTFINKGIIFLNDLVDLNGRFYHFKTLCDIFGKLCSLHQYNQLLAAIPINWKQKIIRNKGKLFVCRPQIREYKWLKKRNINKIVYNSILYNRDLCAIPHKFCNFWEEHFDTPIPWSNVFNSIYSTTVDSKLRMFQLKIIYTFLPTRKMLNIWGIEDSRICRFCGIEEEDLLHIFWYCPVVAQFWISVQKWLCPISKNFSISPEVVVLGDFGMGGNNLHNILILLAKAFVFKAQNVNEICLNIFKKYVKQYYMLEGIIARQNENDILTNKWQKLSIYEDW